jgi:hypothetical protein
LKDYLNGVICYYDTFHTRSFQLIITISIGRSNSTGHAHRKANARYVHYTIRTNSTNSKPSNAKCLSPNPKYLPHIKGLSVYHPEGNLVWKFHRSLHIVSKFSEATNPSSFSASVGSAVRSGTSPSLRVSYYLIAISAMFNEVSLKEVRRGRRRRRKMGKEGKEGKREGEGEERKKRTSAQQSHTGNQIQMPSS